MLDHRLIGKFKEIVGEAGLKQGGEIKGYSIDGLVPAVVLFPGTPEEIERIVMLALEEELSIIPWGGGTQMGLGAPPRHVDLVVCLTHLDRILDQDHENMSFTSEAGIRLSAIQKALRHLGQGFFLPLDPPCAEEVTLGGVVAANASGPSRFRQGTPRDLILGVEVVIPEEIEAGNKIRAGGKTAKNVSGYDMSKLYIGSLGTLAIVVEVTCRILPLPEDQATVVAAFSRLEAPWACTRALVESQLTPCSIELYDRETASLLPMRVRPSAEEVAWAAVGLEGFTEGVERHILEIERLVRSQGAEKVVILRGPHEASFWKNLGQLGLQVRDKGAWSIGLKVSVPLSMAQEISKAISNQGLKINVPCYQLSHAGSGILYAHICLSEGIYGQKEQALSQMVKALREQVEDMGGSLVIEYSPVVFKQRVDVWGEVGGVFPIMERLKREFDPKDILSPGRYVGAI
jgi:glycolate oxidase FAD binding subunit